MNRKYYLPGTYPYYEYDENMHIIFRKPTKIYERKLITTTDIFYDIVNMYTTNYPHPRNPGLEEIMLDWVKISRFDHVDTFFMRFDYDYPGGEVEIKTLNSEKIEINITCYGPRDESEAETNDFIGREKYFFSLANHIEEKFYDKEFSPSVDETSEKIQYEKMLSSKPWEVIKNSDYREVVRLWWDGHSATMIANKTNFTAKTVTNRLSELRQEHGEGVVPRSKNRKKIRK